MPNCYSNIQFVGKKWNTVQVRTVQYMSYKREDVIVFMYFISVHLLLPKSYFEISGRCIIYTFDIYHIYIPYTFDL